MFNTKPGIDIEVYADMYEDLLEDLANEDALADFVTLLQEDNLHDDTLWQEPNPDEYNILPQ